jgi:glucose-1-phosphatase
MTLVTVEDQVEASRLGPAGVRLIVFDFGGVVCSFDYRIFCSRLAGLTGQPAEQVLEVAFAGPLQQDFESGRITGADYHRLVTSRLGIQVPYPEFRRLYGDIFSEIPDTVELLNRLHPRYPLYLLSDTNALHFDYVRDRIPALRFFTEFVLSYEVGAMKPASRIYTEVLNRSGLPAAVCLFIDDRLPNVEGAARVGMRALHYQTPARLVADLEALGVLP